MGMFSWLFGFDDELPYKSTYEPKHEDGELVLDKCTLLNGDEIYRPLIYRTKFYPGMHPFMRQKLCLMDVKTYPFLRDYEEFCEADGETFVGARTMEDAEAIARLIRNKIKK